MTNLNPLLLQSYLDIFIIAFSAFETPKCTIKLLYDNFRTPCMGARSTKSNVLRPSDLLNRVTNTKARSRWQRFAKPCRFIYTYRAIPRNWIALAASRRNRIFAMPTRYRPGYCCHSDVIYSRGELESYDLVSWRCPRVLLISHTDLCVPCGIGVIKKSPVPLIILITPCLYTPLVNSLLQMAPR